MIESHPNKNLGEKNFLKILSRFSQINLTNTIKFSALGDLKFYDEILLKLDTTEKNEIKANATFVIMAIQKITYFLVKNYTNSKKLSQVSDEILRLQNEQQIGSFYKEVESVLNGINQQQNTPFTFFTLFNKFNSTNTNEMAESTSRKFNKPH
ncbi:MAG: hypothetical protein REH83_04985 [Rickettsiella sp.]|nr:hypothetical protein [Rickettsiella sp.]